MRSNLSSAQSNSNAAFQSQLRTYRREESAVFLKTREKFGGLSNMASGFPLQVNRVNIRTSEALYQACRFPHLPDVQRLIIDQVSPMTAKMVGKPYRDHSRPDWDRVRVKIMRWCLRVKLAQNWGSFSTLLLSTGGMPIVEESRKDDFWGAKPVGKDTLVGMNVLGRLLMELREEIKQRNREQFKCVESLSIPDFLLFRKQIIAVGAPPSHQETQAASEGPAVTTVHNGNSTTPKTPHESHPSLFNQGISKSEGLIAALRPYLQHRDAGLQWLESIPAHWRTAPGFAAFREKQVKNTEGIEKQVLSLSHGRIVVKPPEKLHGLVPDSFETYQIVDPGDIIIRSTDLQNDWNSLRVGLVSERGIITSAYLCLRTTGALSPQYGYQLLHALDLMKIFYGMGSGLRQNLSFLDLKRMSIFVPPLDEQEAIVRFLKQVNLRIDRFIRAKTKTVELLNEQRLATIHRAVTSGFDSGGPLRQVDLPWVAKIPKHWKQQPLKQLLSKMDYGTSENLGSHGMVRVLTMGHIHDGEITLPREGSLDSVPPGLQLERNDLLFNRTNSPELVGKVGLFIGNASDNLTFASYLVRLRVRIEHNPFWLNYLLNSVLFWAYARSQALVSLHQANLNSSRYGQMLLPVPPRAEQDEIARRTSVQVERIKHAIHSAQREIKLIKEYRMRLIADVVTGKLDVREAASRLPIETKALLNELAEENPSDGSEVTEEEQTV